MIADDHAIVRAGASRLIKGEPDMEVVFDVKLITDTCTKTDLRTAVKQLFEGDADIALLYFSGHGAETDKDYLYTTDFSSGDFGLRMTDILSWAKVADRKSVV